MSSGAPRLTPARSLALALVLVGTGVLCDAQAGAVDENAA